MVQVLDRWGRVVGTRGTGVRWGRVVGTRGTGVRQVGEGCGDTWYKGTQLSCRFLPRGTRQAPRGERPMGCP